MVNDIDMVMMFLPQTSTAILCVTFKLENPDSNTLSIFRSKKLKTMQFTIQSLNFYPVEKQSCS